MLLYRLNRQNPFFFSFFFGLAKETNYDFLQFRLLLLKKKEPSEQTKLITNRKRTGKI